MKLWSYLVKTVVLFIVKAVNVTWNIGRVIAGFFLSLAATFASVTPYGMMVFAKLTVLTMFGLVVFSWVKTWAGFVQDEDAEEEEPHPVQGAWQNETNGKS